MRQPRCEGCAAEVTWVVLGGLCVQSIRGLQWARPLQVGRCRAPRLACRVPCGGRRPHPADWALGVRLRPLAELRARQQVTNLCEAEFLDIRQGVLRAK